MIPTFSLQTMRDYDDWCPERYDEPTIPTNEVKKLYSDAKRRVPEWRVDEMEAAMRSKIHER